MSSRIQFGNAVHEAENVRSCGLTAQFADFFLARTGPWKHQAAASLVRSGEHNKQVVAKDRAATTTSLWQKIGRPHHKFVAQRSGKNDHATDFRPNARMLAKCPQKPPGTLMRLTRGRTTSHQYCMGRSCQASGQKDPELLWCSLLSCSACSSFSPLPSACVGSSRIPPNFVGTNNTEGGAFGTGSSV